MSNTLKNCFQNVVSALTVVLLSAVVGVKDCKANLIIDCYDPSSVMYVSLTGSGTSTTGTVLGGNRDFFGTNFGPLGASMAALGGTGSMSSDSLTTATGTMQYDGTAGSAVNVFGLGGLDLTQGGTNNQFKLTMQVDLPNYKAVVAVWTGGTLFSTIVGVPVGVPTDVYIPFASFGGADFTNVGAIELRLNTGSIAEADFSITKFSAVPEPSSLLLTLGLGAVGLYRRRRA